MLPVVDSGICASIGHDIHGQTADEYIAEELKQLEKKNPVLEIFIRKFMNISTDPTTTAMCSLLVYKMLESQMECNIMMEQIQF